MSDYKVSYRVPGKKKREYTKFYSKKGAEDFAKAVKGKVFGIKIEKY